jgi:hypothetical protein
MTMPRPSGKAMKIAEQTIPGLRRDPSIRRGTQRSKEMSRDAVELKIIDVNEHRGMNP